MEQSLSTTQEQLSGRVSEVVKLEQQLRRHQTEVKTLKERCASYEDDIADQKDCIGRVFCEPSASYFVPLKLKNR